MCYPVLGALLTQRSEVCSERMFLPKDVKSLALGHGLSPAVDRFPSALIHQSLSLVNVSLSQISKTLST